MKATLLLDPQIFNTLIVTAHSKCTKDVDFLLQFKRRGSRFFSLDEDTFEIFDHMVADLVVYNAISDCDSFIGFSSIAKSCF